MRWMIWFGLLTAGVAACCWQLTVRMPGESFGGSPPPLAAADLALAEALRTDVTILAEDIGERNLVHYAALQDSVSFLEGELALAGYRVEHQDFPVQAPSGERIATNLIAEIGGAAHKDEIVVLGAHYDSREGTPGADDNASGTAALLALARTFSGSRPSRTLRFVFFTNEEYFRQELMGSVQYAKLCRARKENVVAMISLETIGYYSDVAGSQRYPFPINLLYPDTGNFIGFVGDIGSRELVRDAIGAFRSVGTVSSQGVAAPRSIEGVGWSDHWSFWQQGYAGIMITDTAPFRNPHYHEPTDVPVTLNYPRIARVVRGLEAMVRKIALVP